MDILQFIKARHGAIEGRFSALETAAGVKARRAAGEGLDRDLGAFLTLERDYLFPEVTALCGDAEALAATGTASGAVVGRRLKALLKVLDQPAATQVGAYEKRLEELRAALTSHFSFEDQSLMPRLRTSMRTEEREDLGEVLEETEADILAGGAVAAPVAAGRKRA